MPEKLINDLIAGNLKKPETGESIKIPIRKILIGSGVIKQILSLLSELNFPKRISIISDDNTHLAAGAEIERMLCKDYEVSSVVLPPDLQPDERNIELLHAYTSASEAYIAVGGGTISDIVKYNSFQQKKPYICFPTCPSVNGFTSSTSSLIISGYKKSVQATLPKAIIADTDILVQAPERLIITGLGDCMARPTAQADMLLSHHILGTAYNKYLFDIQNDYEKELFENVNLLAKRSFTAIENLMSLLLVSGLSMHISGSSQTASGSEHLIAHYMEMMFDGKYPHIYHGEQIAVTSITAAKIQESLLAKELIEIKPIYYQEKPILKKFGEKLGKRFLDEVIKKNITEENAGKLNQKFKENWKDIRQQILDIHISSEKLEEIIKSIKGPFTYKHLTWEHKDYDEAINQCALTRDRFTFLDLAMIVRQN
ncbi:MAG TPA: hypothetical protein DIV86_02410 [Alphaproteobacteria bacterium]|nr:hypothetical protein [Alphaproteobacteria bacterium]